MTKREMRTEALGRAQGGQSWANFPAIFTGFAEKGIPEDEIRPRENVLTYEAWKALGRHVRRGEHGVRVVTWIETGAKLDPETGREIRKAGRRPWSAVVFHVSQTDPNTPEAAVAAPRLCHCGSGKFPGIMRAAGGWCCSECHNDRTHCPGPVTVSRVKRITSHVGVSRFYAECEAGADGVDIIGSIPRQAQIPSPYRYAPTHPVYSHRGRPVIVVETAHKVYDVFTVSGPIGPAEAA